MRIYHSIEEFEKIDYPVVTAGTFDGVHLGHQKIIRKLQRLADSGNGQVVIITFWPHPKYILNPDNPLKLLTTFEEKAKHLDSLGVHHLIRIPFTKEFSQMTSEQFLRKILVNKIGTKQLVIGHDHRFGKNREGSFDYLEANAAQYGFQVVEISRKDVDDIAVSSTKIREHLMAQQVDLANKLLGRFYELSGKVVKGQQLGRKIGFPTANLEIAEDYKLIPAHGAYAVLVNLDKEVRTGMMNIGVKPTIGTNSPTIEVHIFDFDGDIYDNTVRVQVVEQLRPEIKFSDLNQLSDRLIADRQQARLILSNHSDKP